jgi:PAS domain S-box-containing protein
MSDVRTREGRTRYFLFFLVLVLVVVNSQSLLVSHRARELLTESFREAARSRAELVARELASRSEPGEGSSAETARSFSRLEQAQGLRSACIFDLNGRLLEGGGNCVTTSRAGQLDRRLRLELTESGWAMTDAEPGYDPERAVAFGYLALTRAEGEVGSFLRVEIPARALAELNRSFRSTLIYQVSAMTLLLLAVLLFFHSLLAPHRRLVAEARSVAGELSPGASAGGEEGQFLLTTFQEVVARLKEKERELAGLHQREKARADETEALATDIVRSMTTGLVSLDERGRILMANPATEKIFVQPAAELAGRVFAEVFPGSEPLTAWVEGALSRGEFALRRRVEYRRSAGESIHLGVSVIPLRSGAGAVRGALCLFADLTEVIELRERLFLKENLARLGEVAAGIAHEFRNSLATILGNAKLLKRAGLPADASALVEALVEEGASLSRAVTEFLDFARPEKLRLDRFDLARMASDLARDLEPRAEEASVRIEVDAELCEVEADEMLIRKAVSNLVLNAIDATRGGPSPSGGRVRIAVGENGAFAQVRVRDNGPGIPPEHLSRIFTPFFTTKPEGSGLGLALVQKVAVSHNGRVEAQSLSGGGACFTLSIPRTPAPAQDEWV